MAGKERGKNKKIRVDAPRAEPDERWWSEDREFAGWIEAEASPEFEVDEAYFLPPVSLNESLKKRIDQIKESHSLLRQFTPSELRTLLDLKRSGSRNSWSLREDLMVLTMHVSNRELAEILNRSNKEAVKKRMQLLRSKGLAKRQPPPAPSNAPPDPAIPEAPSPEGPATQSLSS